MIHVIATVEVTEGRREELLAAIRDNLPNVRAEDGCLEYGPTVDVATDFAVETPLRQDVVTVVEKWRDLEALKAHLAAPHMAAYREKVRDIVKGVSLQVLEPV